MIAKRWICAVLLVAVGGTTSAAELKELYPETSAPALPPAREVVNRAFDNLFGLSSIMSVVKLSTAANGQTTQQKFRVLRRRMDGAWRVLTESLAPQEIEGTRVLQIERPDGTQDSYGFVPRVNPDPFPTPYRMADPFLCTWFEEPASTSQKMPLAQKALRAQSQYEVLGRRMDEVDGEAVHRVTIRPMASRGFDRVELAIAVRDFAILEYRNFVEAKDTEPALIARTARMAMVAMDGHLLPTRMRYEDRATDTRIDVELSHAPLPAEIPEAMFEPRSFHRLRIDGTSENEPSAESGQSPKP